MPSQLEPYRRAVWAPAFALHGNLRTFRLYPIPKVVLLCKLSSVSGKETPRDMIKCNALQRRDNLDLEICGTCLYPWGPAQEHGFGDNEQTIDALMKVVEVDTN